MTTKPKRCAHMKNGRLFVGEATVEFVFVAEDEHAARLDAERYAEQEIRDGCPDVWAREITKVEEIPLNWRERVLPAKEPGQYTKFPAPLIWGTERDTTAEQWLLQNARGPTDAEKEAAGQLTL